MDHTLLTRTTTELGPDGAVDSILEDLSNHSAYVGFEPSGSLHLGHLVVAQKMIDLQELGMDITILLADVHASLNQKGDLQDIQNIGSQMVDDLVAFGLDENETSFIFGSDFQFEQQFESDVRELSQNVSLNRARRAMAEIDSGQETVSTVLYPVMQAVDIHHLGVDIAVGGLEQRKVHMLARDALPSIGGQPPIFLHTPLIANLQDGGTKMSSSSGLTISTTDTEEEIRTLIGNTFCPPTVKQDGCKNPIFQIASYLLLPRLGELSVPQPDGPTRRVQTESELKTQINSGEIHPADLKTAVSDSIVDLFRTTELLT